jgi:hypothetical protein
MAEKVKIEGFKCGKCPTMFFGEGALEAAEQHERNPIKRTPALDMLLVRRTLWPANKPLPVYTVINDTKNVDVLHNALYTWRDYNLRDLSSVPVQKILLSNAIEKVLIGLFGGNQDELMERGLPARGPGGILMRLLYRSSSENVYPVYESWRKGEFEGVAKALKHLYSSLYEEKKFKAKVPLAERRIR